MHIETKEGLVVHYTDQCSFTDYYVHEELKDIEQKYNIPVQRYKVKIPFEVLFSKRLVEPIGRMPAVIPHLSSVEEWKRLAQNRRTPAPKAERRFLPHPRERNDRRF
ncbi:hypothetical protein AB1283_19425 [Bacillus sp. S13(2024)]|uniref:hypothetical protein n=1 Tax=unclassified Bacillus (in: firmicutes) TaxID=185979 RepID=UPI003D24EBEA